MSLFSWTVRPRRLKLGTHMDSGQIYHVYLNPAAAAYSSLYFFIFFLSNFPTLKFFITLLSGTVRPRRLKLGTHVDCGQIYHVYWNPAAAAYSSLYFFIFFLSNFPTLKFFITLLSGSVRPRRLKLSTHIDSGWMYHVYQNQAAAAYSRVPNVRHNHVVFLKFSTAIFKNCFSLQNSCTELKRFTYFYLSFISLCHWRVSK